MASIPEELVVDQFIPGILHRHLCCCPLPHQFRPRFLARPEIFAQSPLKTVLCKMGASRIMICESTTDNTTTKGNSYHSTAQGLDPCMSFR
mmetsp:Transcript_26108/g.71936  ORF Transcript_26108/g.71936 Transcript_26108/m.71936 type:complete len:91 (-) Transcript_26108:250-522(-)